MTEDVPSIGWSFYALGAPAPQGSKTPKGRTKDGRTIMVESSKALRPWRDSVTAAAFGAGPCLDGPIAVRMVFTVRRPKGTPKRVTRPATLPDLSKLARGVEDSITAAGLWADDARVAEYIRLAKVWSGYDDDALPVPGVIVAAAGVNGLGLDKLGLPALYAKAHATAWSEWRAGQVGGQQA